MADPDNFTRVSAFSRRHNGLLVWFDADPVEWRLINVPLILDAAWRTSPDMTEFYREHMQGRFPAVRRDEAPRPSLIIQP